MSFGKQKNSSRPRLFQVNCLFLAFLQLFHSGELFSTEKTPGTPFARMNASSLSPWVLTIPTRFT